MRSGIVVPTPAASGPTLPPVLPSVIVALSILDLSEAGAQPMRSDCGRFTVTFNGEIYNHLDIRNELEAMRSRSELARAFRHRNLALCRQAVGRDRGAAALYRHVRLCAMGRERANADALPRSLWREAACSMAGAAAILVFASELKALAVHPEWSPSLDRAALTAFMRYSYVPAPSTIWQSIKKLPAASFVTFVADVHARLHAGADGLLVAQGTGRRRRRATRSAARSRP